MKKPEVTAIDYEVVKNDLDHVILLAPDFVYGYYNPVSYTHLDVYKRQLNIYTENRAYARPFKTGFG